MGLRDLSALQSALAQPRMTFDGSDLYPSPEMKAAALAYSVISNHPFLDGNKRVGHAAMEALLMLNGLEIAAGVEDAEVVIIGVAAGQVSREQLANWLRGHIRPIDHDAGA